MTQAVRDDIAGDATATGATFDPADTFLGLYIDGPDPSPPVDVTSFTLPDATKMPAQKLTTFGPVVHLEDGRSCIAAPAKVFQAPDATIPFAAGGWYLADALTAGNVLAWAPFAEPIPMLGTADSITIIFRYAPPTNAPYDATVIVEG